MEVLRTGEHRLYPEVTDEMLARAARDVEHLAIFRGLGLRSVLIVPLSARGRTIGAITMVTAESGRRFGEDVLRLALALAERAALAVDNARLLAKAEEAARRREEALDLHRTVEQRLALLLEASGTFSASLDHRAVLGAILDFSNRLIAADAYAVWRYRPESESWGIESSSGLSAEYQQETIRVLGQTPTLPVDPVVAGDVRDLPLLGDRHDQHEREGIRAMLVMPLRVLDDAQGTLVFYYRSHRRFSEAEVRVAAAMASLSASAIRTADLYHELKVNDRRKDEFLATLAHELRNPLASIANAARVLQGGDLDESEAVWCRDVVARQAGHLARMLDDLLDVSRINRGKIDLRTKTLDLARILDRAAETVRPPMAERRHRLSVSKAQEGLFVEAAPTRLVRMDTR
jgi:GAF domain-containing protein